MVVSDGSIGRSIRVILRYRVAEKWAKNGVVTIVMGIKRKRSKM